MLAAAAIAVGLLLGLAAGGRVGRLSSVRLKAEYLVLVLFVIQGLARGQFSVVLGEFALIVWGVCSVALGCILLYDIARPGIGLVWLGLMANALVILLNGGMPVVAPNGMMTAVTNAIGRSGGFYLWADERTYLAPLGDVVPFGAGAIASLGDILVAVGIAVFLVNEMAAPGQTRYCSSSQGERTLLS